MGEARTHALDHERLLTGDHSNYRFRLAAAILESCADDGGVRKLTFKARRAAAAAHVGRPPAATSKVLAHRMAAATRFPADVIAALAERLQRQQLLHLQRRQHRLAPLVILDYWSLRPEISNPEILRQ